MADEEGGTVRNVRAKCFAMLQSTRLFHSVQGKFRVLGSKYNFAIPPRIASDLMSTKAKSPNLICFIITVPDPEKKPMASHAEVGGWMEWKSDSRDYPRFEIYFPDTNPFDESKGYTKSGTVDAPVILHPQKGGHYKYHVKHYPARQGPPIDSGPFLASVHPCIGC